jgi:hypothetical protein
VRAWLTKALAAARDAAERPARAQEADELTRLTKYVTELRKRHDEMFQLANRKETALQARVDSVKVRTRPVSVAPLRSERLCSARRIWSSTL